MLCLQHAQPYLWRFEVRRFVGGVKRSGAARQDPIANTISPLPSSPQLSGKRVAVVLYSSYPADPRPRRAAEALIEEGASVEVICLMESEEEEAHECFNGVQVTRIPLRRRRGGKFCYARQYASFIFLAGIILTRRAIERRYDLVHVHNMPDVLVLSALVPKLLGAKVILDLHDPMPELMMTIFGLLENSSSVWLLKSLEKWSVRFADAVLTANKACKNVFAERGCPLEKISVVMNSPDESIFEHREPSVRRLDGSDLSRPFVIMYHGSLVERHGLDLAVLALGKIKQSIPGAELRIYGPNTSFLERVLDSVRQTNLGPAVRYLGLKKLEEVVEAIRDCDVGIIPNRRSAFTVLNTPTRIFEFLSQGKPVVAPRSQGILDYFNPQELVLFELGDADDLATKIKYVFEHPGEIAEMVERGQEAYRTYEWSRERLRFVSIVSGLLKVEGRAPGQSQGQPASVLGRLK
jgi:glycosyltransferase involved in cell wall biosynthesis